MKFIILLEKYSISEVTHAIYRIYICKPNSALLMFNSTPKKGDFSLNKRAS